ncbi:hypoxia induced protein region [Ostertagia ostertagi]
MRNSTHPSYKVAVFWTTKMEDGKYTSIPSVPMGNSNRVKMEREAESRPKSGFSQAANNPAVIVGLGVTTLALIGMFRSSLLGDKLRTQKFMQKRVMAQFFTVSALIAGVGYLAAKQYGQKENSSDSMLHKH